MQGFLLFHFVGATIGRPRANTVRPYDVYVHIFKEYKAKMAESIDHDLL